VTSENVLGEVFYCDSQYAIMIQLADCVGYLLNAFELAAIGEVLSPFKMAMASIASPLDATLLDRVLDEMLPIQLSPAAPEEPSQDDMNPHRSSAQPTPSAALR
jgi:hypothetical protein